MRVLGVTPPPAVSLSLSLAFPLQSPPMNSPHTYKLSFLEFPFQTHSFIQTCSEEYNPYSSGRWWPFSSAFSSCLNSIFWLHIEHSENCIFPSHLLHLLPLEHQPDQRKPPPTLLHPVTIFQHTPHTHNDSIHQPLPQSVPWKLSV